LKNNSKKSLGAELKESLIEEYLDFRKFWNRFGLKHFPARYKLLRGAPHTFFAPLRDKIDILKNYITRDYCLLDIPDYRNIGDHMIYEGSLEFLSSLPYKNRYEASLNSFKKSEIGVDDIIIMQGGGNFGDLWPIHQEFREQIVASFPKNKIIILPQTIYYKDEANLAKAVSIFSEHPDLTICARDQRSYNVAKDNFLKNAILLLPDMASYMNCGFIKNASQDIQNVLFMQRTDKELKHTDQPSFIKNLDVKDWPTYNKKFYRYLPAKQEQHQFYIDEGLIFMAKYDLVISTRLHGGILATLLGIPVISIDNSYGKNGTYFDTWMNNMEDSYFANSQVEVKKYIKEIFPQVLKQ
jgi:pyruvyl transferase EpsO